MTPRWKPHVEREWYDVLMKQPDPHHGRRTRDIIAAEEGVTTPNESNRDPYERLDDLMVVVEALCPKYPEREPFTGTEVFRL